MFVFFCLKKKSEDDVSQFDTKFTKQAPVDSPVDSTLSESANQVFLVNIRRKKILQFIYLHKKTKKKTISGFHLCGSIGAE